VKRKSRSATGASVGQWCNQRNKFGIADRSCLLQSIELLDFIGSAKTNHASEFIARLLNLLHIAFGHAAPLKNQICKHTNRLDPANNVGTKSAATLISSQNHTMKTKYREGVHQEISIGEAFLREEHCDSPFGSLRPSTEISTMTIAM